jgi:RHS repeat-associated protein
MRSDRLTIRLSEYRLFIIFSLLLFLFITECSYSQSTTQNYILSRTMTDSTGTKYMDVIQYYDGLGRPIQKVQKAFSPSGKDLVTIQEYDNYGRESNSWLPTPYSGNGNYTDPAIIFSESKSYYADNSPYSSAVYENSPLNRVMQKYGPGNSWRDAKRCVRDTFYTNNGSDTLRCAYYHVTSDNQLVKSGNYDDSQLYVTRTMDEDYHRIFEFKDKLGQLILTRQINNNQNHDTYYVYDDFGNKCFVLPPIAADSLTDNKVYPNSDGILNRYAYLYKYDFRNRCVWKKLPGAEGINMVYDKADHLIYSQDGEQNKRGEWTFNIPDMFNRTVIIGLCSDTISVKNQVVSCSFIDGASGFLNTGYQLSNQINFATRLLKVEYYDNYNYMHLLPDTLQSKLGYVALNDYSRQYVNTNSGISAKGMHTGSKVFMLEDASNAIITAMYYDSRGQLAQSRSTNHLGGYEYDWYSYTFTGQIDKHRHDHSGLANVKEVSRNYYDQAERLIKTTHSLNDATPVTLLEKTYNDFGQLKTETVGNTDDCSYTYNVRGWLLKKQLGGYNEELFYNTSNSESTNTLCYNGNISSIIWESNLISCYNYSYDELNRLLSGSYIPNKAKVYNISILKPNYSETISYDKLGNITTVYRGGYTGYYVDPEHIGTKMDKFGIIDNLKYCYMGNQIIKIDDSVIDLSYNGAFNFKDGAKSNIEYYYDLNGNLISDLNKKISLIKYNNLNLPSVIQFSYGHKVNYLYDSNGIKRKVIYTTSNENLYVPLGNTIDIPLNKVQISTNADYCNNVIYENGKACMLLTDNGYVSLSGSTPVYHYYLKDHIGNNISDVNDDWSFENTKNYYPFGLYYGNGMKSYENPDLFYGYNGKELDRMHGLDLYDYGARHYDPAIGRWGVMDPLAEKCYSISPYVYCNNNPVRFIDPDGKWSWDEIKKKLSSKMDQAENYVVTKAKEATKSLNKVVEKITGAPLVSKTITATKTYKTVYLQTKLGDRITSEHSISKTIGKANGLINLDVSTNIDEGSKTMTVTTKFGGLISSSSTGMIGVGQSLGNVEAHIGVGLGVGLGEYNWGASYTKNGNTTGNDINIRPGGGTLIGVAIGTAIVTTGGSAAPAAGLAF